MDKNGLKAAQNQNDRWDDEAWGLDKCKQIQNKFTFMKTKFQRRAEMIVENG